jgi:hypothetical protein
VRTLSSLAAVALLCTCGCDHAQKIPEPVVDPQAAQQAAISSVVQLVHEHVSDPIIINQIRTAGMVYHLTGADIEFLKANGVSDPVVLEMQATAGRRPAAVAVVQQEPPPVVGAVYVAPPPVVGVRVGGCWR